MARDRGQVWRTERADRFRVIVDADNYFEAARKAMLQAKRRIMLIGWDFDARIALTTGERLPGEPSRIGEFILWLVERNPELEIFLLRWDVGALKTLTHGNTLLMVARWMRHRHIHTKLDGAHPTGASHHQKIVVIDDCFAFCGGIDMTAERWDTRAHADADPGRLTPRGKPYKPWHDAIAALTGPAAAALGELARDRWRRAGGAELAPIRDGEDCWPEGLAIDMAEVDVGIARTIPAMPEWDEVREIEALFVAQILEARHSIYAESQYFASRKIAEAMATRLAEPDGPEIVLINPVTAQGWLEPLAMDTARTRILEMLRERDPHGRFRMYHPHTVSGEPIYVHAKMMFVDGRTLRIGSANMNNRSLGLDTECDLVVDAANEAQGAAMTSLRDGLLAEHLGTSPEAIGDAIRTHGSLIAAIEALRLPANRLRPHMPQPLGEAGKWIADNEVLDPESPDEMFEPLHKRGLFRRLRHPRGG